ncbi:MAG: hypothetical protein R2825_13950 [Saprospiraceae bacterium]
MHNSFISIVAVVENEQQIEQLPDYLKGLYFILENNFSDFEIILVNNSFLRDFSKATSALPDELRQNIYLLNLSSPVNRNHALVGWTGPLQRRLHCYF